MTQHQSPKRAVGTARQRWLTATALTLLWVIAPDVAFSQGRTAPNAQAPAAQADPMAQIQQMQRQMEQLQRQIQQMQGAQGGAAPAQPRAAAPQPVMAPQPMAPQSMGQPMMAQPMPAKKMAAPGKARGKKAAQKKPATVTVLKPKHLQQRNITKTRALASSVPSMIATSGPGVGTSNSYFIRGVGNTETIGTADPAVGTYVDDIFVSRQSFNNFAFFDMDSIEIARGPQGTAGGRNVDGGAISLNFQKPQNRFGGTAEIGYGKDSNKQVRASVNIPISDAVLTSLGGYFTDDSGYVTNITNKDKYNGVKDYGFRLATTLRPADMVTWDVGINHMHSNELNALNFKCKMFSTTFRTPGAPADPNCPSRFAITKLARGVAPSVSNLTVNKPAGAIPTTLAGNKAQRKVGAPAGLTLVSSNVALEIGEATTFNFITGYIDSRGASNFDLLDGRVGRSLATPAPATSVIAMAPNGANVLNSKTTNTTWSQEFRASGDFLNGAITYVGGLYYAREANRTDAAEIVLNSVVADRLIKNKNRQYAGYFESDLHVTQNFTTTLGMRYTIDQKRLTLIDQRDGNASPFFLGVFRPDLRLTTANLVAAGLADRLKAKKWTPRLAFSYAATPDALMYISATRGFRAGGWNARATEVSSFNAYNPEKVWTYEAGAKSAWLDDSIHANVALFSTSISNFQVNSFFTGAAGTPTYTAGNVGSFSNSGLETELELQPIEALTLYGNFTYQKAKYSKAAPFITTLANTCLAARGANTPGTGVCGATIVTPAGLIASPVATPKLSGVTGASFDMNSGFGVIVVPALNISYQGRWQNAPANVSYYATAVNAVTTTPNATGGSGFIAGSRTGSVFLFNASLGFETENRAWRAALECDNCLNKSYSTSSLGGYSFLNEPMKWNFKVKTSF